MVDSTQKRAGRVGEIGEEELVRRLTSELTNQSDVLVGPGDDCAVVENSEGEWFLLKTDCIVEGIHFLAGTNPEQVGRKAMNRALSDIAAMGGLPRHALVTIAVGAEREVAEVEGWYAGMRAAAETFGCGIVGGETSSLPTGGGIISVALVGTVEPQNCIRRSGADLGDVIAVTGMLGGSFESGRHLDFVPRIHEARFLVENASLSAMMDLSDGLGSDLPRLIEASGVGFRIDPEILPLHDGVSPGQAVCDGEDYELLLTMSQDEWSKIQSVWIQKYPETPLTHIGDITKETETPIDSGWEHFQEA